MHEVIQSPAPGRVWVDLASSGHNNKAGRCTCQLHFLIDYKLSDSLHVMLVSVCSNTQKNNRRNHWTKKASIWRSPDKRNQRNMKKKYFSSLSGMLPAAQRFTTCLRFLKLNKRMVGLNPSSEKCHKRATTSSLPSELRNTEQVTFCNHRAPQ